MCGRYTLSHPLTELKKLFEAQDRMPSGWSPRYNIAPSQQVPVIVERESGREIVLMRWGLIPSWADDQKIGYKLINARAETVPDKPAFRKSFRSRRCLVPADGFYEWKKFGTAKTPLWIHPAEGDFLFFAGLWDCWVPGNGEEIESFTILTTASKGFVKPVHERMPLTLTGADAEAWLNRETDIQDLLKILKGARGVQLQGHAVSKMVNSPRVDEPACIEKAAS